MKKMQYKTKCKCMINNRVQHKMKYKIKYQMKYQIKCKMKYKMKYTCQVEDALQLERVDSMFAIRTCDLLQTAEKYGPHVVRQ